MKRSSNNGLVLAVMLCIGAVIVAGCGGDRQMPSTPPKGTVQDQIKAVQNDPKMAPAQKAMAIGQLQMQEKSGSGATQ